MCSASDHHFALLGKNNIQSIDGMPSATITQVTIKAINTKSMKNFVIGIKKQNITFLILKSVCVYTHRGKLINI